MTLEPTSTKFVDTEYAGNTATIDVLFIHVQEDSDADGNSNKREQFHDEEIDREA